MTTTILSSEASSPSVLLNQSLASTSPTFQEDNFDLLSDIPLLIQYLSCAYYEFCHILLAFAQMTLEERKDWNELSMGLFWEKKFTNPAMTKGESSGIYGTGKKIKSYEAEWNRRGPLLEKMNTVLAGSFKHEFNEKGLPAFSATLMNNNPPEAFSSTLTFTTSGFENTPHIDNDSSYIAAGWWMQVNEKTGEFYFPQENARFDFSKVNGICQIIWMANKVYHSTLPSKDTKKDTQLGMSCQVAKKLSKSFEKYRCGLHPSHFKLRDGKSFS
ncbi:hypothetical protein PPACK8108_LOCUS695 [Phakopsora pachyrhizi]|uniref:Tet-like 2OG-Fe(II) oxygenase domain-containing protein n=1 Tax=Phakopsora pachyrhizi TaxID=170000 RepID=A0AAV0AFW9_PHAPC|nr:hypothetical protein PPACK8108_LOCUS695 [Phakopsora pachyrhizi]